MTGWGGDVARVFAAVLLVLVNGFFVAVEFSLVKLRESRLDDLVQKQKPFAATAQWLQQRLDAALSACQLGITMASLGLGWIGEPAIAHLLRPGLAMLGIEAEFWLHGIAFVVAFTTITALHLVIGEQVPKIFALRRPESVALWGALPLKTFYFFSYPLMAALNASTSFLLNLAGVNQSSSHQDVPTEEEIQVMMQQARSQGYLSRSEHRLINAVFEFDDQVCRKIMQPRSEVVFLDADKPLGENIGVVKKAKHSRFPVCRGSLDNLLGIIHIKDLVGREDFGSMDIAGMVRQPQYVPETILISKLLRQFQSSHQHLAFVIDEYGIMVGIVTLEDVIEEIVGPVEDEFDASELQIVPEAPGRFVVAGGTAVAAVNRAFNLDLDVLLADTFSGFLMASSGKILTTGDRIEMTGASAEVIEAKGQRAVKIRVVLEIPSIEGTKGVGADQ